MKPFLVTPAASAPVTLVELKQHLDITWDTKDTVLAIYIGAATKLLDGYSGILGRAILNQTWAQKLSEFPFGMEIPIPIGNVQSITHLKYYDTDNVEQTFSSANYTIVSEDEGYKISLNEDAAWPATYSREDAITLTWVAGYGAANSDVPDAIRLAIMQLCAHWFESPEAVNVGNIVSKMPLMVESLLAPFRLRGV